MDPLVIVAIAAAFAGVAAGWLLGSRLAATLRRERDAAVENHRSAVADLAVAEERAKQLPALQEQLHALTAERNTALQETAALRPVAARVAPLEAEIATLRAERQQLAEAKAAFEKGEEERRRAYEEQLANLKDLETKVETRFGELAGKALEGAHDSFLKRAEERFKHSEQLASNGLKALLQPVNERLQRYEEGVAKVEAERRDAFGNLVGLIESMRVGQEKVSAEAAKLVNSLRNAPKSRGRWGEQQLKNVLETCGLTENCDFQTEVSVESEDGRLRPDVIIRIPGGRTLIIDAKVSLNAYQDAFGAVDEAERNIGLAAHAAAMRAHVTTLGNKAYQNQFGNSPDYVIMFVPGEHFLSAALEHDPSLWDYAFDRKVLLATPTNLIAIARSVASVWQQEALAKNARDIALLGKELYDRLAKVGEDLRRVGTGLNSAVTNFNTFTNSFNSRLVSTGRKFRELNIETGSRELDDVPKVEALASAGEVAMIEARPIDEAAE
ncbi:DNA recombination protein RmuC [Sphingomonas parva]|uniref:DNA recombination protein RmuC homolog n=1 Tax=Sphingomonas parva TaxID=2555898 RepID=A0A4Y8ZQA3_9SPHN|nr:DNA recombination protein RmuC [Sphingomonas parva]TFI58200.1 DNA recombination protein RmuC [Sphingomonas parva]